MTINCYYCDAPLPESVYDQHCIKEHPESIEQRALFAITSAQDQVAYIYDHYPETRRDNGLLLLHFAKGYPKLVLSQDKDAITLSAPYSDFFYFLKRANSITRLGRHIRQPKRTGEELTAYSNPLKTGIKTKDAVMQVLMEVPQARYNEGVLAEKVLRYFQPKGIYMDYSKDTQEITLKAPKSLMLAVLRHIESIARASRKLRSTLKLEGISAVPERRQLQQAFSTLEWAQRAGGDWLPNTYVPMRD